jgi:hypothetical protein
VTSAPAGVTISYGTPTADLGPAPSRFGSQPVGDVSAQQTVTVTNHGAASLIVSGVQTGGTDPGDYLIADDCGEPVAPGDSCQIGVRFAPQALGASAATLTIDSNAPTAPAPVALSGTGIAAATGATGPQGPTGPQGSTGPRGVRGAAGAIVCRNTVLAKALCTLEFAPGTFTTAGIVADVTFRVIRGTRTVLSGTVKAKRDTVSMTKVGRLRRGRYTLILSSGHGRASRLLLRDTFQVS